MKMANSSRGPRQPTPPALFINMTTWIDLYRQARARRRLMNSQGEAV